MIGVVGRILGALLCLVVIAAAASVIYNYGFHNDPVVKFRLI